MPRPAPLRRWLPLALWVFAALAGLPVPEEWEISPSAEGAVLAAVWHSARPGSTIAREASGPERDADIRSSAPHRREPAALHPANPPIRLLIHRFNE